MATPYESFTRVCGREAIDLGLKGVPTLDPAFSGRKEASRVVIYRFLHEFDPVRCPFLSSNAKRQNHSSVYAYKVPPPHRRLAVQRQCGPP